MKRVLLLAAVLAAPGVAWGQTLTANEFAAFAPEKLGQQVTVASCYASNASSAGVDCVTFAPPQAANDLNWSVVIPLDGNTIDRPSLLRALNNCADLNHREQCKVSVTGIAYDAMAEMNIKDAHTYGIKNARLNWLYPAH
ncbi:hypothetical protein [Acetobacter indonesiensis]|uniref:hypothetical protein n=1 Tax=Acetobacter indonesiensis TaxID=104101 RepID=UPI0020A3BE82|nr:hypothetical protein [Acetobacter indonesiensis]MCP1229843.1 hypothetical protein [Acetobacter indonesiensis]